MTTQQWLWDGSGAALGLALVAGILDWRRLRRSKIDAVGWVPWRGVQVVSVFAAIACAVVAMHA